MTRLSSVAVYCGAMFGNHLKYRNQARRLGEHFAHAGIRLVFGGGGIGLMGALADGAVNAGGQALGIIPEFLRRVEIAVSGLVTIETVKTMHERKQRMAEVSDAFVMLPGGLGTLDETLEIITWRQLGVHDKPVVIVDQEGYWGPLLALIEHTIRSGFTHPSGRDLYTVVDSVDDVIPTLQRLREPLIPAKIERA